MTYVVRTVEPTEVLLPSNQPHLPVVVHVHYHCPQPPASYQQLQPRSASDEWTIRIVTGFFTIVAAVLAAIAAKNFDAASLHGKSGAYSQSYNSYPQPIQPTRQYCWREPQTEYLGYVVIPVTRVEYLVQNGYGGWYYVTRNHYEPRYRNYDVRVCSW